jgi:hypothetical protein
MIMSERNTHRRRFVYEWPTTTNPERVMYRIAPLLAAAGIAVIGLHSLPARADADDWGNHQWRHSEWREHAWREHGWREQQGWYRDHYNYGYYDGYYAPPTYYAPYGYAGYGDDDDR